jgi:hypothetical protein
MIRAAMSWVRSRLTARRPQPFWGTVAAVISIAASLLVGCMAQGTNTSCRVGADCASGLCSPLGVCIDIDGGPGQTTPDALSSADTNSTGDAAPGGDGSPGDGGPGPDGTVSPDGPTGACNNNNDGIIQAQEVPLQAGLHATYRTATDVPVNTAGMAQPDGTRLWDLSGNLDGDHALLVETLPIQGQWFAADFPNATYASRLSESQDLLGVFQLTADALLLLGVVSPDSGTYQTKLTYDPPAAVLQFPLHLGQTYTTDSTVSGTALGVASVYTEKYEQNVDVNGSLVTPFGTFKVLRVQVTLTRTVGIVPTVVRSFLFVAECFGTVATVVSKDNETETEFSQASEVRRLAP